MQPIKRILSYIFVLLTMLPIGWSCTDELELYTTIKEGESLLTTRVSFNGYTPALDSRSAGNAIKTINTLWVVIYDSNDNFIEKKQITDFTLKDVSNTDRPDDGYQPAEANTGHAEFKLVLPNGKYHIYAVANYDLTDRDVSDIENLKNIPLRWQDDDASKNNQMFGFFTNDNSDTDAQDIHSFAAPDVVINGNATIHAWVRRAASKLTIVYDGSGLKEGVFVYIKSATIKDIPQYCYLGSDNTPGQESQSDKLNENVKTLIQDGESVNDLIPDGETVKYYQLDKNYTGTEAPGDDFHWTSDYHYRVTCGGDTVGSHSEIAPALYFYENRQPKGEEGTMTDKRQDVTGANKQVSYPDGSKIDIDGNRNEAWKDARPYGTYVEIQGYYISIADGKRSRGDIIYRFMLGKDVITSYDAERNFHYKLTMKFNGYANDVDFHIEYSVPKPSLNIPPYYISYLYDHSMMLPVSISSGNREVRKVTAYIKDNRWAPYNCKTGKDVYWDDKDIENNEQWHGFLSLRETHQTVLYPSGGAATDERDNRDLYKDNMRGTRVYADMTPGSHYEDETYSDSKATDIYTVDIDKSKPDSIVYNLQIPMYTRAKQMIKRSGYTGNNPYVAYQRKAVVEFKVWFVGNNDENKPDLTRDVDIIQARRVVNPKGVYRNGSSPKPFHVMMSVLPAENATNFKTLTSEGPWRAYVIRGNKNLVQLGKTKTATTDTVEGKTGSKLDFWINFTGATGYAIIRVDYHNYSCNHLIFVRNEPYSNTTQLLPGGAKWHTTNLRTTDDETNTPVDEGSLFRYGNFDQPIDASCNINSKTPWVNIGNDDFKKPGILKIATQDGEPTDIEWKNITFIEKKNESFGNPGISTAKIASFEDYNALRLSDDIEFGYGVLYGNDADECATDIDQAYGYRHDREDKAQCGMRGTFAYNASVDDTYGGRSVFFPIGNSGYGRRKGYPNPAFNVYTDTAYQGMLKYAGRDGFYPESSIDARPLFYDIFRRPGAIYWIDKAYDFYNSYPEGYLKDENGQTKEPLNNNFIAPDNVTPNKVMGWDFNYFTFDYYPIPGGDVYGPNAGTGSNNYSDACFIRLVEK